MGCLQVDQAALTGESLPVKKFSGDVCFSGSSIKQGEKHAIVYATGANTFFGRAAALISGTHNVANLQKIMTRIGACCLITIGVWVAIEVIVAFAAYHHTCKAGAGEQSPPWLACVGASELLKQTQEQRCMLLWLVLLWLAGCCPAGLSC